MSNFTDEEAAFVTEHGNKVSACFPTLVFLEQTTQPSALAATKTSLLGLLRPCHQSKASCWRYGQAKKSHQRTTAKETVRPSVSGLSAVPKTRNP
jgi:hypothetical protein